METSYVPNIKTKTGHIMLGAVKLGRIKIVLNVLYIVFNTLNI